MKTVDKQLDELDKKVLTELPFIIEILTTTLKKLSSILENHFIILKSEIEVFIKEYEDWQLSKKDYGTNCHYPFWDVNDKKITITDLEEFYRIDYYLYAYKGDENNKTNIFLLWIGFEYSKYNEIKPCFFYYLLREPIKKFGANIPNSLLKSFKEVNENIEIEDPLVGDNTEGITFYNYNITDIDLIEEQFEIFRTKIFGEYLKNIKW